MSIAAGTTCASAWGRYQTPSRGGRLGLVVTFLTDALKDVGSSAPVGQTTCKPALKPGFYDQGVKFGSLHTEGNLTLKPWITHTA